MLFINVSLRMSYYVDDNQSYDIAGVINDVAAYNGLMGMYGWYTYYAGENVLR